MVSKLTNIWRSFKDHGRHHRSLRTFPLIMWILGRSAVYWQQRHLVVCSKICLLYIATALISNMILTQRANRCWRLIIEWHGNSHDKVRAGFFVCSSVVFYAQLKVIGCGFSSKSTLGAPRIWEPGWWLYWQPKPLSGINNTKIIHRYQLSRSLLLSIYSCFSATNWVMAADINLG